MSRFTDSPYFLLKDFMLSLVAPVSSEYINSDIVNLYERVVFTDVIWIGGATNIEDSTDQLDTLLRHPSYNPSTDQTSIFTTSDVAWNGWYDRSPTSMYHIDPTEPSAGVLVGGDNFGSIVVDGGSYVDMYAKLDDYGFVPVRFKPVYENPRDKKYFRFDVVEISTIVEDETLTIVYDSDEIADEPYYDSGYVSIQSYDFIVDSSPIKWGDLTIYDILQNGTEIYFRKDSSFHDWLKDFAHDYYQTEYEVDFIIRNYVNTDKRFIYFGEIFTTQKDVISDPDKYHIVFNGMKDWVQAALPPNNRTDNLVEFMDTYFDQVYSEGYQLLKDVWSLRDARESDRKFVGYIPSFYDMPNEGVIEDWFVDSYREYAAELVWLMKRKGTYASMYIIYEILCRNSNNIFNVLERWHESGELAILDDDTFAILDDDGYSILDEEPSIVTKYEDHIYTGLYGKDAPSGVFGAGPFWYSKFDTSNYPEGYLANGSNLMLSPFYRVDLDLSVEPMTSTTILPEQLAVSLYNNWELQRPVNRQTEYNLIYAPFTDLTATPFSLYESPNIGQSVTTSIKEVVFDENNYLHLQKDSRKTWYIEHPLNQTELIITSYDVNFEKQIPASIEVIDDNNIKVEFDNETTGVLIVSKASGFSVDEPPASWRIRHGLNRKEIIWQVRTIDDIVYFPESGYIENNNTIYVDGAEDGSTVFVKSGISIGDEYDSTGDGEDDSTVTDDIWVFDDTDKLTTDYYYDGERWISWVISHGYAGNTFQVNCYDESNIIVSPAKVILGELDGNNNPIIVVLWEKELQGSPNDYLGFAAISDVGDIISFSGVVPFGPDGEMLPVEYRLTIETDDEIYTSLFEGSDDANVLFAGKEDKTIHYYDPSIPDEKPFVYGDVTGLDDDGTWYYYTFVTKNEGLDQLNEKGYKIIAIEIINPYITRFSRQRIVYSRLSGIYKPFGVNFVGHFRLFQSSLSGILLDSDGLILLDHLEKMLTT